MLLTKGTFQDWKKDLDPLITFTQALELFISESIQKPIQIQINSKRSSVPFPKKDLNSSKQLQNGQDLRNFSIQDLDLGHLWESRNLGTIL